MSGFNQDDGFFQSGYYDNQHNQQAQGQYAGYDYGGQQFGQDQWVFIWVFAFLTCIFILEVTFIVIIILDLCFQSFVPFGSLNITVGHTLYLWFCWV